MYRMSTLFRHILVLNQHNKTSENCGVQVIIFNNLPTLLQLIFQSGRYLAVQNSGNIYSAVDYSAFVILKKYSAKQYSAIVIFKKYSAKYYSAIVFLKKYSAKYYSAPWFFRKSTRLGGILQPNEPNTKIAKKGQHSKKNLFPECC